MSLYYHWHTMVVGLTTHTSTAGIAYVKGVQTAGCLVTLWCVSCKRAANSWPEESFELFPNGTRMDWLSPILWKNNAETFRTVNSVTLYYWSEREWILSDCPVLGFLFYEFDFPLWVAKDRNCFDHPDVLLGLKMRCDVGEYDRSSGAEYKVG